ncbi:thiol-disulfide oxidoreductase DCC family protein [Edaphobacter flagellatus]|uniref:thiol-disulfide oxidoreductase DCC family protein n=1 Tax=Edaphobacter flagellatus TaxID=1933044 RepID=UPI0021B43099|nr:DCC1-like thiol-disulfide oxidoreductase family protein [Edaphobacter flagellatus]
MTQADRAKIAQHPILLYDGVCALCNGSVRFVLRHDAQGWILFAPLESDIARELLEGEQVPEGMALVTSPFRATQRIYWRSDAALEVLRLLGWNGLARLLQLVPRPLREAVYGLVARMRYKVFGRYDVCPLPAPAQRERFLGF